VLNHYAQNDVMLEVQKRSYTWSKAEIFIRVTVQTLKTENKHLVIQNLLSHTELIITARQQTFSDQLCYVHVQPL